jgi:signal transduction histidine kinase
MKLLRTACLPLTGLWLSCAQAEPGPTTVEVFVDQSASAIPGPEIIAPHDTSQLRFEVDPRTLRSRYKLEGLDQEWHESTDEMNFIVRFLNRNGDQILQEFFPASGESPGWRGAVENSEFMSRREIVTVPPEAEYLSVAISSAGPADAVGILAVSGITVTTIGTDQNPAATLLDDSLVRGTEDSLWIKSGTHPSMALSRHFEEPGDESPIFYIEDDDTTAHADWATGIYSLPKVVPGQQLEVRWKEAYSIGIGGALSVNYERLPPGVYRFVVEDLSLTGVPMGGGVAVAVEVPRPYWQKWWFWLACIAAVGGIATLWIRRVMRRKIKRHLRHAQLIADERLRIARDLHDDLGTRLSHISLLSTHSASAVTDEESSTAFRQITNMSGELIGALSETVWMLNSKNNDLESLVDFLCRLVSELCRLAEIRCRIDAMSVTKNRKISHEFRHNFSLSVKESVNNALRHSGATEIKMAIWLDGSILNISVSDNGVGLEDDTNKGGSGIDSITQRMKSIRGTCVIEEFDNNGLQVSLSAPLGKEYPIKENS